jgi:hypothetical protein
VFKIFSNITKFYCPNKTIYYFFKINTKISTSFRRSMLISFWIYVPGADPGWAHPPPPKIGKNMIFGRKIVIFHTKYPKHFRASAWRNFCKYALPPNLKFWIRPWYWPQYVHYQCHSRRWLQNCMRYIF